MPAFLRPDDPRYHRQQPAAVRRALEGSGLGTGDMPLFVLGDVMTAAPGELYGPHTAGPHGCTTVELFSSADGPDGPVEVDVRTGEMPPGPDPFEK